MEMSAKAWLEYAVQRSNISQRAIDMMQDWLDKNPEASHYDTLNHAYNLVMRYGQATGALSCKMYEATAEAQGAAIATAEMADLPNYDEVGKAVNGTMKQSKSVADTIGRLIKQVGEDTILKNARRDGAEFAWVPSGDSCAFCITLASRGWQHMSKTARNGNHAEHIHANCDCTYAVRFDGKSTVAGYDPDKYLAQYNSAKGNSSQAKINALRRENYAKNKDSINARKRELYAEQAYRKDYGAVTDYTLVKGVKDFSFSARRVKSYDSPVLVSDKAKIKPKALNTINQNTEKAMAEYGIPKDRKPTIVILSDEEIGNAYGAYDACTNTIYYHQGIAKKAVQDSAGGAKVIERHETWHLRQAENFRKVRGEITKENHREYIAVTCERAKANLDRQGFGINNVKEISDYAFEQYEADRYDEAEAEMVAQKKGKIK